jgi:integrase
MEKINKDSGAVVTADDMTVVDFYDKLYLPLYEKSCKPASVRSMSQVFDFFLRSHFGTTTLRAYKAETASAFLNNMKADRSRCQLQHIKRVASALFTEAIEQNRIETRINPWAFKLKKTWGKAGGKTYHYTREQAENIISALVGRLDCQIAVMLSCFLGLRHGEIRGLQWDDIDNEWIHIRRSVDWQGRVSSLKTEESERDVPLLDSFRLPLESWHEQCKSGRMLWLLSKTQQPVILANLANRVIKPTIEKAAAEALAAGDAHRASTLVWKDWHSGRRCAATLAIEEGDIKLGQRLLGHESASTTLAFYDKVLSDPLYRERMRQLDMKRLKS